MRGSPTPRQRLAGFQPLQVTYSDKEGTVKLSPAQAPIALAAPTGWHLTSHPYRCHGPSFSSHHRSGYGPPTSSLWMPGELFCKLSREPLLVFGKPAHSSRALWKHKAKAGACSVVDKPLTSLGWLGSGPGQRLGKRQALLPTQGTSGPCPASDQDVCISFWF